MSFRRKTTYVLVCAYCETPVRHGYDMTVDTDYQCTVCGHFGKPIKMPR